VDTETHSGMTGERPALSHRLEALVAHTEADDAPDLPVGPVLAASLTGLRAEIGGMRADLETVRRQVGGRPGGPIGVVSPGASGSFEDAVEERLAAIEDTLDGLAERFEALARDSAMDAGERLASLDDRLSALAQSLQAERTAAALHREQTTAAAQEQSGALDEWAEAVRGGLEELSEAVTGSLGSLGTTLTGASASARDAERRHLEALVNELSQTVEEAFAAISEQVETYSAPLDGRLQDLHHSVLDGFGGARARLIEELSGTISRLEQANSATRATVATELTELRGDLADALDEVRERVETTVSGANESIDSTLEEHHAASASLRDGIAAAALHSKDSGERVSDLHEVVTRLDGTLSDLQSDWRPQVDAVVAQGRAAAQGVLEEVKAEVDAALAEMTTSLRNQVAAISDVTGSLGGGTDRLVGAGQALLAYLGERDRWLERERDRVLHEVLDEFAQGLSAKERRAVSSRMTEALDRRRDARDAERFRRTEVGKPAIEIPPIPAELAELAEPVVPRPPARRAAAPANTSAAKAAATPTRPAVKKTATATKKSTAKKAPAAKAAPAKTAAKKATPRTATAAKTVTKRATATKAATKRTGSSSS
jgi:hypothetical protein